MDLRESLGMAVKTLTANKLRSTLTMLGIIIGNASVIAMVGIGEGAQKFVSEEIESLGPNVLFVVPGNQETQRATFNLPKTLVLSDAEAIAEQVPSVVGVAPEFNDSGPVVYRNRSTNSTIVGTTPGFPLVRNFIVGRGRFFTDLDMQRSTQVAVLGYELADRLFQGTEPVGQQIRVKNVSFQVIGVLEEKGAGLGGLNYDEAVLVPLLTLSRRLVGQTSPFGVELTYIVAAVDQQDNMGAAEFQIANLLRLRHKITGADDFVVRSQKDLLEFTGTITGALTAMLAAIAGISLLVGGIGIMNIMLVSVRERTQEIGLRKAIGASGNDILVQFMIEAVILSAAGGIIGTGIGVGGAALLGVVTPFQPGISVSAIVISVVVSGSIGLFFGVVPARQAAQLDPIVALRSA
ncbi:MAG: ABC transporter permease [Synechococcales cyanobacterium K44_A2020_017]|uniref:ABC transporter permease n=1 Tax=Leptolyngbya sp. CCY15150 TaxID=2767772 RepID=UPI00195010DE|nr:ABC transporter permease [Leptolyngbya sp. CCY15150]MBF2090839.1 ABC transporter permease [Synechococcales cyanobacterium K32_A2020_035]MBF2094008.1 ABC transporter permease [Synechococcales cyanobacterium K44_A2020_017]